MLSPTQQRIFDYLAARSPVIVGGYELRDATCPNAGVKSVHVQIHLMRARGAAIESVRGPYGGFRVREMKHD